MYVPQRPSEIVRFCTHKGVRGSCYNDAILLNFLLQVNGFKVRNVSLDFTDGYGGSGHTVVEVWIPDLNRWVLVDAQNLAIFYDSLNRPMGALDLKKGLEGGSKVSVVQYGDGYAISAERLLSYYRSRISTLVLIRKNDFETRYHRFPVLGAISSLEGAYGKVCLLAARFLYNVITGKERVVYKDRENMYFQFSLWNHIFNVLLLFWLIAALFRVVHALLGVYRGLSKR